MREVIDPKRKEAGADFSDRPKSRAERDWMAYCHRKHILWLIKELEIQVKNYEEHYGLNPARSGADEGGTGPENRAKMEQSE